jgi:hypothetical protein
MFERYGLEFGLALVAGVTMLAFLIGRQAAQRVAQFRDEHHQSFTERHKA